MVMPEESFSSKNKILEGLVVVCVDGIMGVRTRTCTVNDHTRQLITTASVYCWVEGMIFLD